MVSYRFVPVASALFLLWLFGFSGSAAAASLQALVDRNEVDFGESVNLTVTATGLDGEIDFSVLEDDFDILDTRRSRNVRIINGKSDSTLVWQIGLMPLNSGELKIPSFSLGGVESAELVVKVKEPVEGQQGGPGGRDFYLEINVDKNEAYVQEQIILTARVYQTRNIIEGSLSDPAGDGLMLQRLGSDQSFKTTVDGREYHVIERRYAIFAQESGEHKISPLRLVATVRQDNRSGQSSGFFTPTQKIRVASNSLVLSIKPKPADGHSGWWLPAETITLTSNWSEDITKARVDEPVTRIITLAAKAVLGTQLPPLEVPELASAKIYPDQPDIQTQATDGSLITYRTDKWAIIPRSAGPLTIPELRIEWYDTINKKIRYAVLPDEVIEILPSENAATSARADTSQPGDTGEQQMSRQVDVAAPVENLAADMEAVRSVDSTASNWRFAFFLLFLLWLVTLGLWFLQQRKKPAVGLKAAIPARRTVSLGAVEEACRQGDPAVIVKSLLSFAKERWPENPPHSIGQLSARLNYEPLAKLLKDLDRAAYARGAAGQSDFASLAATLKEALRARKQRAKKIPRQENLLPEL